MGSAEKCLIRLLGKPCAERDGQAVRLVRKKGWGVLASLLLAPLGLSKETLAERYWTGGADRTQSLDQALSDLRRAFGRDLLHTEDGWVRLREPDAFVTDLDELNDCLEAVRREPSLDRRVVLLRRALALGEGEPLAGLDTGDGWLDVMRSEIEAKVAYAASELARMVDAGEGPSLVPTASIPEDAWGLSVFAGPFPPEYAVSIVGTTYGHLKKLVQTGVLVRVGDRLQVPARERAAAWTSLQEDDRERVARRHARFFATLGANGSRSSSIRAFADSHPLALDWDEFQKALRWHTERASPEATMKFIEGLWRCDIRDLAQQGGAWCETTLAETGHSPARRRRLAWTAGVVAAECHDLPRAIDLYRRAIEEEGIDPDAATLAHSLAFALHHTSRHEEALQTSQEAARQASRLGRHDLEAAANLFTAEVLRSKQRFEEGLTFAEASLAWLRTHGSRDALAEALFQVATLHRLLNKTETALAMYEESLSGRIEVGDLHGMADCLRGMAMIQSSLGQTGQAWTNANAAVEMYRKLGKDHSRAAALGDLAEIIAQRGSVTSALDLLEEALDIWKAHGHLGWIAEVSARIDSMIESSSE